MLFLVVLQQKFTAIDTKYVHRGIDRNALIEPNNFADERVVRPFHRVHYCRDAPFDISEKHGTLRVDHPVGTNMRHHITNNRVVARQEPIFRINSLDATLKVFRLVSFALSHITRQSEKKF
jgi:hypothetical protein